MKVLVAFGLWKVLHGVGIYILIISAIEYLSESLNRRQDTDVEHEVYEDPN